MGSVGSEGDKAGQVNRDADGEPLKPGTRAWTGKAKANLARQGRR